VDSEPLDADEGGVWRALNPLADMEDVYFEWVTNGLAGGEELTGLWVTEGSNTLHTRNSEAGADEEVWEYEDFLAAMVELDSPWSNTGLENTDKVTLKWNKLTGAEVYEIKLNTTDSFDASGAVTVTDQDDEAVTVTGLDSGKQYFWKVRVKEGSPLRSRFSRVWTFTTKLGKPTEPTNWQPENGETGVVVNPSFGWNSVSNADSYEIEVSNTPDFSNIIASATTDINSWAIDTTLSYNTTYYWRVRALADSLVISGWRTGAFTTMTQPTAPPPPVEVTPPPPAPEIVLPAPVIPVHPTPVWVWAIIGIGAALIIAVIVLVFATRQRARM
jgi:hypothetical protein